MHLFAIIATLYSLIALTTSSTIPTDGPVLISIVDKHHEPHDPKVVAVHTVAETSSSLPTPEPSIELPMPTYDIQPPATTTNLHPWGTPTMIRFDPQPEPGTDYAFYEFNLNMMDGDHVTKQSMSLTSICQVFGTPTVRVDRVDFKPGWIEKSWYLYAGGHCEVDTLLWKGGKGEFE